MKSTPPNFKWDEIIAQRLGNLCQAVQDVSSAAKNLYTDVRAWTVNFYNFSDNVCKYIV